MRFCVRVVCALALVSAMLVIAPSQAKADIFETNNAGSCSGGGSAGGGLCYEVSPGTYEPYSLSGLLSGAYGPLSITNLTNGGTTEYVVTDDIPGGSFSYTYNLTAFTNGTTPPVWANNVVCQVNGSTTADFADSSTACTAVDMQGTNTGTINSSGAFRTGAQINNAQSTLTVTFDAVNGYDQTFDLGFVSMQNTGTVSTTPEPSSLVLFASGLFGFVGLASWRKKTAKTPLA